MLLVKYVGAVGESDVTTKHNWLARCQYKVTGWVSMWAYDMLSQ